MGVFFLLTFRIFIALTLSSFGDISVYTSPFAQKKNSFRGKFPRSSHIAFTGHSCGCLP